MPVTIAVLNRVEGEGVEGYKDDEVDTRVLWKAIGAMQEWFRFTDQDMQRVLGGMPALRLSDGKKNMDLEVSKAVRDRVSLLLGIYSALQTLRADEQAATWIDRPNTLEPFNGARPRDFMVSGEHESLALVRWFLDQWSNG